METNEANKLYALLKKILIRVELPEDLREKSVELLIECSRSFKRLYCGANKAYTLSEEQYREILPLINKGQKLDSIRLFREFTGSGLLDAKNIVEEMIRDN